MLSTPFRILPSFGNFEQWGTSCFSFFHLFIFLWHSNSFVPQSSLFLGGFVYHFFFYGCPLGWPIYKDYFVRNSFSRFTLFFKGFLNIRLHPSGFWYFLLMFCSKAFLFALLFPPPFKFQRQFIIFDFTLMEFLRGFWVYAHWSALKPL